MSFISFIRERKNQTKHTKQHLAFQVSKMGLTTFLAQLVSILKAKL